jgi:hypothetical protein
VLARLNLTLVLAALALLDLALDRVVGRLFMPAPSAATPLWRATDQAGTFVSYLGGALAVFLFASAMVSLLRRRELFPRSMRFVVSVLTLFFVALFAISLSQYQLSQRLFVQLKTSHAFLSWLVMLSVWRSGASLRAKLGVSLLALPALMHTGALFAAEMGWGRAELLPADIARAGQFIALSGAALAPVLLLPRRHRALAGPWAWAAALAVSAAFVAGVLLRFDLVQLLAQMGLRIELPPLAGNGGAYALLFGLACFGWSLTVAETLRLGGVERLVAGGLVLLGSSGYAIQSPSDLAQALCGLLAVAVAVSRRALPEAAPPAPV